MSSYSRDGRDIADFAAQQATRLRLTPDQTSGLSQRLTQSLDWLKSFRRALSYATRYQGDPAQVRSVMESCAEIAVKYTRFWGPMTFVVRAGYTVSPDGFRYPDAIETELTPHTFYPLFRDGVRTLSLHGQVGVREHDLLLRVLADRVQSPDRDAFMAVWSARLPGLAVTVAPALEPHAGASLVRRQTNDAHLGCYMRVFEAASPFDPGMEQRPSFTSDTLPELEAQGLSADRARAFLAAFDARAALPPVRDEQRASARAHFGHAGDREARLAAVERWAAAGGSR